MGTAPEPGDELVSTLVAGDAARALAAPGPDGVVAPRDLLAGYAYRGRARTEAELATAINAHRRTCRIERGVAMIDLSVCLWFVGMTYRLVSDISSSPCGLTFP